ncbi:TonB-dependent receptor plug domain-containing protein [Xanthomonas phaseoli]|uniref:TonB-dependent receptor plug domain-containing protein n=1 Tax=Xanthomonas phaseoli TaxID=1985254 RepID=UPI0002E3D6BE|nr:TonB-dependent receptor plug domain-containing protein [Xanthomonas phaseoli]
MKRLIGPRRSCLAVQLSLCLIPTLAWAQQPEAAPSTRTLDSVQVTGTRIKTAELQGQVPIQTLNRADIERTGLTSIGEVLQELTASGSALNAKFNSSGNFGFPPDGSGVGAGSAQVDLRHLGSKRVLVLVDGIRWVNESSASGVGSSTDLNTIPLAIVERIEVLEDGASSLYGSDAIAGVVNIITRRTFDGAQVTLNYGQYGKGDGTNQGMDLAWGTSGENFSLFLGASYVKQDPIYARDRAQARFPIPGTGLTFASSATPDGRFQFVDPNTGVRQNLTPNAGVGTPQYDGSGGCTRSDDYHCFGTADRYNFAEQNLLLTPSERKGVFAQFRYYFNDDVQWYVKALGNRRESTNQAAPEPIFLGPDAGTGNPLADNIVISALNPFNPFGFDLDSATNLIQIGRRPVEGGPRRYEQQVDTQYFGTGLVGTFEGAGRTWFWDVNGMYSKNKAEQTNYGSYNLYNINLALGDPAACAAVAGCVPLDIFSGAGSITPEMLRWIQPVVRDRSQNELSLFTANLSSELFQLPGGAVSFAGGYEYRKYEGAYQPDPLTVAGRYNGVPSLPTSGSYDVNEAYLELNIPIFANSALGDKLDLNIAGRYSDYSTFGGEFTPKYGLRWQVTDEFVLRTSYDAQAQLDLCVDTLDALYCDGIGRASTGGINAFNNRLTNLGSIKTDGWDVDLFWTLPQTAFGRFKLSWQNTLVGRYEALGAAGQRQPQGPGIEVVDSAIPEWTSNAVLDWSLGNWTASWTARHISKLTEQCGDAVEFAVCSDPSAGTNRLDAITYHDAQVGYRIDWLKGLQLTAGLNNVFDKDPPICLSCSLNGYDASTYDIPGGRFWYARVDLKF